MPGELFHRGTLVKWNISYANSVGALGHMQVEADTKAQAILASRLPPGRIVHAKPEAAVLAFLDSPPPTPIQISFLASLSSGVGGGKSVDKEFISLMEANKFFKPKVARAKTKTLCSERMKLLKFNPTAVMLAEVGERSGTLAASIATAAKLLSGIYRIEKEMSKGATPQIILIVIMISLMCASPFMFEPIFAELSAPGAGVRIETTFATSFLFGLQAFISSFWPVLVGIGVALFLTRKRIWKRIKRAPVLTIMNELHKAQRATRFVSTYTTLDYAGIPATELIDRLQQTSSGVERAVFAELNKQISKGKPLSESFDHEYFPDIMIRCLFGMEMLDRERRRDTLELLQSNLVTTVDILSDSLVSRTKLVAWIVVGLVLIMVLVGFYYPLVTLSS